MNHNARSMIAAARGIVRAAEQFGLDSGPESASSNSGEGDNTRFYFAVTDTDLRRHTEQRFGNGHYQDAAFEAFKYLNNYIKSRAGLKNQDGTKLMEVTFSPNSPILCINEFKSQSDIDEQTGYMKIYAGSMQGIRNPRAHENEFDYNPENALELLTLANHLLTKAKQAKRRRRKVK